MKRVIVYSILLCAVLSCKKNNQKEKFDYDTDICLSIVSPSGIDLLNPNSPNHIVKEDIEMYYDSDGKRETYASRCGGYLPDNPDGFTLGTSPTLGGKYYLNIYSNDYVSDHSITVLTIKGSEDIKLVTEVVQTDGSIKIRKVWHNGILVWPYEGAMGRVVHIELER